MGRCFSASTFLSAGNITHTPAYGHMIALGLLATVQERNVSARQIADAAAYREMIAHTEKFLTFCGGGATIGYRHAGGSGRARRLPRRAQSPMRVGDQRQGRHAHQPCLRRGRFISGSQTGIEIGAHRATFIVPVGAPVSPRCAARSRCATPIRSSRRCPAATTSLMDRCGWTRCSSPGSGSSCSTSAGADRALAVLASALLLAVEGRVHAGSGAGLHVRHGAGAA